MSGITWTKGNSIEATFPYKGSAEGFADYIRRTGFCIPSKYAERSDALMCEGEADFGKDKEILFPNCKLVSDGAPWTTRVMIDGDGKNKPSATPGFCIDSYLWLKNFRLVGNCWNTNEDGGLFGWKARIEGETVGLDYVLPLNAEVTLENVVLDGRTSCDWPFYVWSSIFPEADKNKPKSRKVTMLGGEVYGARCAVTFGYSGSQPQQSSVIDGTKFYLDAMGSVSKGESSAISDDRGAVLSAVVVREGTHVLRNVEVVYAKGRTSQYHKDYGCQRIAALVTDHFSTDPQKCDITIDNCKVSKLEPGLSTVWNDVDVRHSALKVLRKEGSGPSGELKAF